MQGRGPDFIGLGVQKGGTTTLHTLLAAHPQVMLPATKELHFFTLHHGKGEAWYRQHFAAAAANQRCGEITPYYIFHPLVPERIQRCCPEARLLVLLRDPVERSLSQVFHSQRLGLEPLGPEEALEAETSRLEGAEAVLRAGGLHRSHQEHSYLARSRYGEQLQRYEALFGRERLWIQRSEDLFEQPQRLWSSLQRFLGLEVAPLPPLPRANAGRGELSALPLAQRQHLRAWLQDRLAPMYALMAERYGLRWERQDG